jgi:hypothetical protein
MNPCSALKNVSLQCVCIYVAGGRWKKDERNERKLLAIEYPDYPFQSTGNRGS